MEDDRALSLRVFDFTQRLDEARRIAANIAKPGAIEQAVNLSFDHFVGSGE